MDPGRATDAGRAADTGHTGSAAETGRAARIGAARGRRGRQSTAKHGEAPTCGPRGRGATCPLGSNRVRPSGASVPPSERPRSFIGSLARHASGRCASRASETPKSENLPASRHRRRGKQGPTFPGNPFVGVKQRGTGRALRSSSANFATAPPHDGTSPFRMKADQPWVAPCWTQPRASPASVPSTSRRARPAVRAKGSQLACRRRCASADRSAGSSSRNWDARGQRGTQPRTHGAVAVGRACKSHHHVPSRARVSLFTQLALAGQRGLNRRRIGLRQSRRSSLQERQLPSDRERGLALHVTGRPPGNVALDG